MKIGIIAPIKGLKKYCTTEVQYCLPSLILKSEKYREFYLERKDKGNLVLLDSRKVGWRREPESLQVTKEAVSILEPSVLILPSYMYDSGRTVDIASQYLRELKPKSVVGCVEGTTEDEAIMCAKKLTKLGLVTLAIPSHLFKFCKQIVHNGPTIYIENHLNMEELDGQEGVLVTSLPVRLGLQGRLISDYLPSPPSLTFHEKEDNFPNLIRRNIEEIINFYEE